MTNFSEITIRHKRDGISNAIKLLQRSMDSLKDPHSDYAEHHQHVINTYRRVLDVLDEGIADSMDVGKGV